MQKMGWLCVLLCGAFVFGASQVGAASELETWCKAQGQAWSADTCTIGSGNHVELADGPSLTLLSGQTLVVYGRLDTNGPLINGGTVTVHGSIENGSDINNQSVLDNHGLIKNRGQLKSYNTLDNSGTISNLIWAYIYNGGTLTNEGAIVNLSYYFVNEGAITNHGTLQNHLILTNDGRIENHGDLYNGGTIANSDTVENHGTLYKNVCVGSTIEGNPVTNLGTITDLDRCSFVPVALSDEMEE